MEASSHIKPASKSPHITYESKNQTTRAFRDLHEQPSLKCSSKTQEEERPIKEIVAYTADRKPDEWDNLLMRKPYWTTLRITAWALRFRHNNSAK